MKPLILFDQLYQVLLEFTNSYRGGVADVHKQSNLTREQRNSMKKAVSTLVKTWKDKQ